MKLSQRKDKVVTVVVPANLVRELNWLRGDPITWSKYDEGTLLISNLRILTNRQQPQQPQEPNQEAPPEEEQPEELPKEEPRQPQEEPEAPPEEEQPEEPKEETSTPLNRNPFG